MSASFTFTEGNGEMTRGLVICALACGVAAPAGAGERNAAVVAAKISVPRSVSRAPDPAPAPGTRAFLRLPRARSADFVVRIQTRRDPAATRSAFETLPAQPIRAETTTASRFGIRDVRPLAAWRVTDRLAPVTARDNGTYAVRDTLADYRKPRTYRPSALNAMFVLRIDGKEDSAPFSVGGGGVAAALWKAMPQ